jgi:hypothetical protein
MTEVKHKPRIDRWVGRRDDGVWFMMPTEEQVRSFDGCACTVGRLCEKHETADPVPIIWKDVQRL